MSCSSDSDDAPPPKKVNPEDIVWGVHIRANAHESPGASDFGPPPFGESTRQPGDPVEDFGEE